MEQENRWRLGAPRRSSVTKCAARCAGGEKIKEIQRVGRYCQSEKRARVFLAFLGSARIKHSLG